MGRRYPLYLPLLSTRRASYTEAANMVERRQRHRALRSGQPEERASVSSQSTAAPLRRTHSVSFGGRGIAVPDLEVPKGIVLHSCVQRNGSVSPQSTCAPGHRVRNVSSSGGTRSSSSSAGSCLGERARCEVASRDEEIYGPQRRREKKMSPTVSAARSQDTYLCIDYCLP